MRHVIFTIVSGLSLLGCVALLLTGVWSFCRDFRCLVHLPGGIELSASGWQGEARLTVTRWRANTKDWYKARRAEGPVVISAETARLNEGGTVRYAARLIAQCPTKRWGGFELNAGAISPSFLTDSTGPMSTPLAPYRSLSMPWYYPTPILLVLPGLWMYRWTRRRRRRARPMPSLRLRPPRQHGAMPRVWASHRKPASHVSCSRRRHGR